jgi:hypothetical protein
LEFADNGKHVFKNKLNNKTIFWLSIGKGLSSKNGITIFVVKAEI